MKCPECGKKIKGFSKFCKHCGKEIKNIVKKDIKNVEEKAFLKQKINVPNYTIWSAIGVLVIIFFIIFGSTAKLFPYTTTEKYIEKEPYTVNIPYTEKEPYTVQVPYTEKEPYTAKESYQVQVPYQAQECQTQDFNYKVDKITCKDATFYGGDAQVTYRVTNLETDKGGYFTFRVGFYLESGGTSSDEQTYYIYQQQSKDFTTTTNDYISGCFYQDIDISTKQVCQTVTKYKTETQYRDVTKYRTITKYKTETRYKDVTKTRTETKYNEVEKQRTITKYKTLFQAWGWQNEN